MAELKTGDTTTYKIAGVTITLQPVTLGKMKKAMSVFLAKDADTFDMLVDHLAIILDNGSNPEASREWLSDNVTLPLANQMIDDMRAINGLDKRDFLAKGGAKETVTRDLAETKPPIPSA